MDQELYQQILEETIQDYERYGKGKPVREWLIDILGRHLKLDREQAIAKADEIHDGIAAYRSGKTAGESHESGGPSLPTELETRLESEAETLAETLIDDLVETMKLVREVSDDKS